MMEKNTLKKAEQKGIKKKTKKSSDKNDIFNSKTNKKSYYSFTDRVFFLSMVVLLFLSVGYIFLNNSFELNDEKEIRYSEKGNVNYKVYLKDNDFYDSEYLDKDMMYVSHL